LQGFKKEVASARHERFVTYLRNDRNWASAEWPLLGVSGPSASLPESCRSASGNDGGVCSGLTP
jgi:hypothetical protein